MRALLAGVARRLRLAWGVATGHLVLPVVAGAAVVLVAVGFLVPWWWPEPLALGLGLAVAVALWVSAGPASAPHSLRPTPPPD